MSAYAPVVLTTLAVDVGGTKVAVGIVTDDGDVVVRRQIPTPDDAETLFAALVGVIDDVRTGDEVVCGVGCGGPMEPDGVTVSPLNIPGVRRFPLKARLHAATGLQVFVDNDAKALALAEGWRGVARGERNYLAMVVSTGVGAGIVVDGRLLDGDLGNAGHIGHVIVRPGGNQCACGARGCLEAEASGSGIRAATGRSPESAGAGVVEHAGTMVGRAVASVCNLLDLKLAAVAGSVALGFGAPFFAAAQAELDACARLDFSRGARIVPAGLGDAGPLVGAAAVGLRGLGALPS